MDDEELAAITDQIAVEAAGGSSEKIFGIPLPKALSRSRSPSPHQQGGSRSASPASSTKSQSTVKTMFGVPARASSRSPSPHHHHHHQQGSRSVSPASSTKSQPSRVRTPTAFKQAELIAEALSRSRSASPRSEGLQSPLSFTRDRGPPSRYDH